MSDQIERRLARLEAVFALPPIDEDSASVVDVEPDTTTVVTYPSNSTEGQPAGNGAVTGNPDAGSGS